ncbi:phage regulatory CII family protein [Ferrovibrio xuzhouensis]|uniref:Phage regulatory CII family protein n=1 Tax=Ferrovibrio xuzhouensis TaxID=1576914 RepID=A0ABV7VB86_9PROT
MKPRPYGDAKSMVDDLIRMAGGHKAVADRLGLNVSIVYAYGDPAQEKDMGVSRAAALTAPDNAVAAEFFAHRAGGIFMPLPQDKSSELGLLTSDMARESGEALAAIVSSLLDGEVTQDEARVDVRELDDLMRKAAALRSRLMAIAEGVGA